MLSGVKENFLNSDLVNEKSGDGHSLRDKSFEMIFGYSRWRAVRWAPGRDVIFA